MGADDREELRTEPAGFRTRAIHAGEMSDNLIRVSVGSEDLEDVVADFETGLCATRR